MAHPRRWDLRVALKALLDIDKAWWEVQAAEEEYDQDPNTPPAHIVADAVGEFDGEVKILTAQLEEARECAHRATDRANEKDSERGRALSRPREV